jgi:methionine synthase I (cobalamin-dependent)/5,10-methylenetetrahydrofolate reductase
MPNLIELADKHIIVGDGATGTVLHKRLPKGSSLDLAAIEHPEELLRLHIEYITAGSMLIQTHTFGASRPKLAQKNAEDKFEEINTKAVKIAREAREITGKPVLIGGSIGPYFQISDQLDQSQCQLFCEQALILEERGCDLLMLETFPMYDELECAIKAVREVSSLPIMAQMTITDEWSPSPEGSREYILEKLLKLPAIFVGLNCGAGPDEYLEILEEWGSVDDYYISLQPNAGVPVRRDGRFIYPHASPEYFAYFAQIAARSGVKFIGGCCGTTPEHIKAVTDAVRDIHPKESKRIMIMEPPVESVENFKKAESDFITKLESDKFTTVIQLDPPKGTNVESLIEFSRIIKKNKKVCAVDINANPLGRLHFDSLWLAGMIEMKVGLATIPHITPRDASLMGLESQLLGAWYSGVKNLLIITGDPSQKGDYPGAHDVYQTDSIGLVRTVNKLNHARDWGGNLVGDPPSFVIGVAVNPGAEDRKREIEKLKQKIDYGARFAMSQIFYTWDIWESFWEEFGTKPPIPVMVGIWPLISLRLALRIHNEIPEVNIPDYIFKLLEDAGKSAREVGWELAKDFYGKASEYADGAYLIAPYKRGETVLQLIE